MTPLTDLQAVLAGRDICPEWTDNGCPNHAEECPSYDGTRCRAMGFRPGARCEPAVVAMAEADQCARGWVEA